MTEEKIGPTLNREERLWQSGHMAVAGIDEAGRGALAGPVTAAATIIPAGSTLAGIWAAVRDSKLLTPARRYELAQEIEAMSLAWGVGHVEASIIDQIGIAPATRQAMAAAVGALAMVPDFLLIDWVRLPALNIPQESFVKADRHCTTVAAASILAKVHRDRIMIELDKRYPHYKLASNKGYGSQAHRDALNVHGPCPEHRHSFAPIAQRPTLFTTVEA